MSPNTLDTHKSLFEFGGMRSVSNSALDRIVAADANQHIETKSDEKSHLRPINRSNPEARRTPLVHAIRKEQLCYRPNLSVVVRLRENMIC